MLKINVLYDCLSHICYVSYYFNATSLITPLSCILFSIIQTCLATWAKSPGAYETFRDSELVRLPSPRLLQYYKNSCDQKPGTNDDNLDWMQAAAIQANVPEHGYEGFLAIDAMTIQVIYNDTLY